MNVARRLWIAPLVLLATSVLAQQPALTTAPRKVTLHIEPQAVGDALSEFGRQTGLTVMIQSVVARGVTSPKLDGNFTLADALDKLLSHTGLHYEYLDAKTVAVLGPRTDAKITARKTRADEGELVRGSGPESDGPGDSQQMAQNESSVGIDHGRDDSNPNTDHKLEQVVVTGTYIRGIEPTGSPIRIYDREQIEQSGAATLSEFAAKMPENFSSVDPSISRQNFAIGQTPFNQSSSNAFNGSAFNLHGIGPGATLTLLNGHRVAPAGYDGSFTDISQIPLAAIDHIEVLTDGASAIYGADAVAGVVNIITRKDFSGVQTGLRYGYLTDGGGQEENATQLLGKSWTGGNVMATYEFYHQNPVDASERDYIPPQGGAQSLIPKNQRNSLLVSGNQQIGDATTVSVDAIFSARNTRPLASINLQTLLLNTDTSNHVQQSGLTIGLDRTLGAGWHTAFTANYSRVAQTATGESQYTGLFESSTQQRSDDDTRIASFESITAGPLFPFLGGAVKGALDAGFRKENYDSFSAITQDGVSEVPLATNNQRSVSNAAAELFFPFVGEQNAQPWAKRLELSVALRLDHYSDFGSTFNPKYGLRWKPTEGVSLRATYGRSFRAPLLSQLNGGQTYSTAPFDDPSSSTGTADVLELDGNNPSLRPEISKSFTGGFELRPPQLDQLTLSATYFHFAYDGRISFPPATSFSVLSDPALSPFITRNPTAAQVQALFNSPYFTIDQFGGGPNAVTAIFDNRLANVAESRVSGLDFLSAYIYRSRYGDFNVSISGDRQFRNEFQATSSSSPVSLVNIVGEPPRWKARANSGWRMDGFSASISVNYTGSYENVYFAPPQHVASWVTTDVYLGYRTAESDRSSVFNNLTIALSATNLTDAKPPNVILPSAGLAGGVIPQLPYDPVNANPIGRRLAVNVTKMW